MSDKPSINFGGNVDMGGGDIVAGDKNETNIAQQVQGDLHTESNQVTQNVGTAPTFDDVREAEPEQAALVDDLEAIANTETIADSEKDDLKVQAMTTVKNAVKDFGPAGLRVLQSVIKAGASGGATAAGFALLDSVISEVA